MAKSRHRRDEPLPQPGDYAVRGVLGASGLTSEDLRAAAVLNHDLYGFYGVSVWIPDAEHLLASLEKSKLVKFTQYATFTVADLITSELEVWATGQAPPLRCGAHRSRYAGGAVDIDAASDPDQPSC